MPQPGTNAARPQSSINAKLNQRLTAYVAAAGAAGVTLFAAQPADAKVVYTAANTVIGAPTAIDLNHDGVADFTLEFAEGLGHSFWLMAVPQVTGNAVRGNNGAAAAGFLGVPVGPGEKFTTNSYYGKGVFMAGLFQYSVSNFFGPFANATNRYLGFKFLINGQVHFGWARMTVTNDLRNVVLTGYAYETTPNTNIIEGHTSGPEKAGSAAPADLLAPAPQPATLGMLARGADGLALWRREEDAVAR